MGDLVDSMESKEGDRSRVLGYIRPSLNRVFSGYGSQFCLCGGTVGNSPNCRRKTLNSDTSYSVMTKSGK